jgi:hypothetical protein
MERIGTELHADPYEVITQVSMDNGKELQFEDIAWVPQTLISTVTKVIESDAPDQVVNEHDKPIQMRLSSPEGERGAAEYQAQQQPPLPSWNRTPEDAVPPKQPMTATEARQHTLPGFAPPEDKPRRGRRPNSEKVVGPGPIPPETFQQPAAPSFVPPPPAPPPPQPQTFVQPPVQQFIQPQQAPQQFGLQQPQPASAQLNDMLTKAFGARN